ncbi:MAG: pseudaminic acid synthase [Candidatus Flexifilum sp.]
MEINNRRIGPGQPVYIIAELSANHHQEYAQAVALIHAAKQAGADAIKLQTYTPDTITIASDKPYFRIEGTIWAGRTLHDLYGEAYTPWEWQPGLKAIANDLGMDLFSSPFDPTAVAFLNDMGVPAFKIASFELNDIPLIQAVARTGKPTIMSTGMATLAEIDEAVRAFRAAGGRELALLRCTSAYPADPAEAKLTIIPHLEQTFGVPAGLSDHTMGIEIPVAAVALGARLIEKHFTLSRAVPGPDSKFSLEPDEFKAMVDAVRLTERALGRVEYGPVPSEQKSLIFRRSLFVVADVKAGEPFTPQNVRSIRPGHGLHTRHLPDVLGRRAARDIERGTPLSWALIAPDDEA